MTTDSRPRRTIAVVPGSFDPVTVGHIDIIERAARLFDSVVVAVMTNAEKSAASRYCFPPEFRRGLIEASCAHLQNVRVIVSEELLARLAVSLGATVLCKGARNSSDFDYEAQLSRINTKLEPELDTVIFAAEPEHMHISSSFVRELFRFGLPLTDTVPAPAIAMIDKYRAESK